jgi:hypothetical protein
MTRLMTLIIRAAMTPNQFWVWVVTYAMDVQATVAMVALTAGSVARSNFSSIVCCDGMRFGRVAALIRKCFSIVC